jgi:hypothetical protein
MLICKRLFFVPLDPLVFLCLSAPLSFSLRLDIQSAEGARGCPVVFSEATDIPVESLAVYLILLKSHYAVVELFLTLRINSLVKRLRISEKSGMKQKVGGIINQKFLRRNRLATFRSFTHDSQTSTIHINKPLPFIANAHHTSNANVASAILNSRQFQFV